jgi:hypothetical protein
MVRSFRQGWRLWQTYLYFTRKWREILLPEQTEACVEWRIVIHLLTPWSRVLLEKLTVNFAASQEIPRIYETRKFLTEPTSARHIVIHYSSLKWNMPRRHNINSYFVEAAIKLCLGVQNSLSTILFHVVHRYNKNSCYRNCAGFNKALSTVSISV